MKKSQQRTLGGDDVSTLILTKNKRQSYKNRTHDIFINKHDLKIAHCTYVIYYPSLFFA
jgi:hypothetical protein